MLKFFIISKFFIRSEIFETAVLFSRGSYRNKKETIQTQLDNKTGNNKNIDSKQSGAKIVKTKDKQSKT